MSQSDIIYEIKERLDIVDVISEYVTLKRAGQNYKGLCPFHSEKTPSFTVNPSKQIFYCFGCHQGGDVIKFIMSYNNMNFSEAISFLADKVGIQINKFTGQGGERDVFYKINRSACDFFKSELRTHQKALDYFHKRGITDDIIEDYELGYSPNGRDLLYQHLLKQGYRNDDILKAVLVHKSKEQYFDFFRDRIMFPIIDQTGKVIAFGGRRLSDNTDLPKYINSSESPVFKKGETLFGLNKAKGEISRKGYSIVVEGYMDVLTCHQYGFLNVVAPLGTAITLSHLKKLKKISQNIVFLFDGDSAGINAAKRAIELSFTLSIMTKLVILSPSEDPDSLLRKKGSEELKKLLSKAISPVSFYFKLFGKNVLQCTRNLLNLLLLIEDILIKELYLKEISERAKISETSLRQELDALRKKKKKTTSKEAISQEASLDITTDKLEEFLLSIVIYYPSLLHKLRFGEQSIFTDEVIRGIFDKICNINQEDCKSLLSELMLNCSDLEKNLLSRLAINHDFDKELAEVAMDDCIKKIALREIDKKIKDATESSELELLNKLIEQKKQLTSQ